ncbi:MAG: alpha/beta fold hydrolase [Hyphomicrobiales bacterium]
MTTARIEPADHTIDAGGLRLHYLDWGTEGKPPLVLLHGFSSQAHYWDGFSVRMRDDCRVIAVDQRGHGDSDWSADYGPDAMPNDLLALADHLGLERFTLVGHSMGGGVSMRFATRHPERVERMVIVDAGLRMPGRGPNPDNSVSRALAKDTFESEQELYDHYRKLAPGFDPERAGRALWYNFRKLEDGRITYKFDPSLRNRFTTRRDEMERSNEEVRAAASRVTCPVLILRGARSDILSAEAARETAAAFPNGRVLEIPNTTHMIPTDDPRAFRAAVREFMGLPV